MDKERINLPDPCKTIQLFFNNNHTLIFLYPIPGPKKNTFYAFNIKIKQQVQKNTHSWVYAGLGDDAIFNAL
jgi:hypothetical protein